MASAKHIVRGAKASRYANSPSVSRRARVSRDEVAEMINAAKESAKSSAVSEVGSMAGHAAITAGLFGARWAAKKWLWPLVQRYGPSAWRAASTVAAAGQVL